MSTTEMKALGTDTSLNPGQEDLDIIVAKPLNCRQQHHDAVSVLEFNKVPQTRNNNYDPTVATAGIILYYMMFSGKSLLFAIGDGKSSWEGNYTIPLADVPKWTSAWHHILVVYDASSSDVRLYVDGTMMTSANQNLARSTATWYGYAGSYVGSKNFGSINPSAPFKIGGAYDGLIDEVQIYKRALSDAEVQSLAAKKTCKPARADCKESDWSSRLDPAVCTGTTTQQTRIWTKVNTCVNGVVHQPLEIATCAPVNEDVDSDGMKDVWETRYGLNPNVATDASTDPDGDGMTNLQEYLYFTRTGRDINPLKADTDGDGWSDGEEYSCNSDPIDVNGVCNGTRVLDRDADTMNDAWETRHGLNPNDAGDASKDSDSDGLTNLQEYTYYTQTGREIDPLNADTDSDGWSDNEEKTCNVNPIDASSKCTGTKMALGIGQSTVFGGVIVQLQSVNAATGIANLIVIPGNTIASNIVTGQAVRQVEPSGSPWAWLYGLFK